MLNLNQNMLYSPSYSQQPINIIKVINEVYCKLKNTCNNLKNNIFSNSNENLISINQNSIESLIIECKNILKSLDNILNQLSIINEEYYDFFKLNSMFNYFLDNIDLINDNTLEFITNLFIKFFDMIFYKINHQNDIDFQNNYKQKYEKFRLFLFNQEKKFYSEFYISKGEFNEQTFNKVSNLIFK